MQLYYVAYLLLCASSQVAWAATPAAANISTIQWFACEQNATLPVTCGTLEVPLDYTDTNSNKTLQLQLVKVNATTQPSKGSILLNPGGPGESTRDFLGVFAPELMVYGNTKALCASTG